MNKFFYNELMHDDPADDRLIKQTSAITNAFYERFPKKIHLVRLGEGGPNAAGQLEDLRALHPDWEVKVWTDECLLDGNFLLLQAVQFNRCEASIASRLMALEILFREGGAWIDASVQCSVSLAPIAATAECLHKNLVANQDGNEDTITADTMTMHNVFMMSKPSNECIGHLINMLNSQGATQWTHDRLDYLTRLALG